MRRSSFFIVFISYCIVNLSAEDEVITSLDVASFLSSIPSNPTAPHRSIGITRREVSENNDHPSPSRSSGHSRRLNVRIPKQISHRIQDHTLQRSESPFIPFKSTNRQQFPIGFGNSFVQSPSRTFISPGPSTLGFGQQFSPTATASLNRRRPIHDNTTVRKKISSTTSSRTISSPKHSSNPWLTVRKRLRSRLFQRPPNNTKLVAGSAEGSSSAFQDASGKMLATNDRLTLQPSTSNNRFLARNLNLTDNNIVVKPAKQRVPQQGQNRQHLASREREIEFAVLKAVRELEDEKVKAEELERTSTPPPTTTASTTTTSTTTTTTTTASPSTTLGFQLILNERDRFSTRLRSRIPNKHTILIGDIERIRNRNGTARKFRKRRPSTTASPVVLPLQMTEETRKPFIIPSLESSTEQTLSTTLSSIGFRSTSLIEPLFMFEKELSTPVSSVHAAVPSSPIPPVVTSTETETPTNIPPTTSFTTTTNAPTTELTTAAEPTTISSTPTTASLPSTTRGTTLVITTSPTTVSTTTTISQTSTTQSTTIEASSTVRDISTTASPITTTITPATSAMSPSLSALSGPSVAITTSLLPSSTFSPSNSRGPIAPPRIRQQPSTDQSAERIVNEIEENLINEPRGPPSAIPPSQSTVPKAPGIMAPPGAQPPNDIIVNELNKADDFMAVARRLRLLRRKVSQRRRKRMAEYERPERSVFASLFSFF